MVKEQNLYHEWNDEFDVPEFDDDLVCGALQPEILSGGCIVDFHSCDFMPKEWF